MQCFVRHGTRLQPLKCKHLTSFNSAQNDGAETIQRIIAILMALLLQYNVKKGFQMMSPGLFDVANFDPVF